MPVMMCCLRRIQCVLNVYAVTIRYQALDQDYLL
jgi:hypothetical protein